MIEELDEAEEVDTAWCIGDEGAVPYGRAVIAHVVRIFGGDAEFDTWDGGRLVKRLSFVNGERMPFSDPLGNYLVHELSHPEPLTISHYYPSRHSVACAIWAGCILNHRTACSEVSARRFAGAT